MASPSSVLLLLFTLLTIFSTPSSAKPYPSASASPEARPWAKPWPHPNPLAAAAAPSQSNTFQYDVIIYGGTPAAISAAVQVKRMGKTVAIVNPDEHLGGLTSSGLGWTDSKNGNAIGGIAREFYSAVYKHYLSDSAWIQMPRQEYVDMKVSAQPGPAVDGDKEIQWTFEPKVAESIFKSWINDNNIPVYNEHLDRSSGSVSKSGTTIKGFKTLSGKTFNGNMFIDAGYEGDLMDAAGISFSVGRDSASVYGESAGGQRVAVNDGYEGVDPYKTKGNSKSGLLLGIQDTLSSPLPQGFTGSADDLRIQSFNYRLCLTHDPGNKIVVTKPAGYHDSNYELLLRLIEAGHNASFTADPMPNRKTDSNSEGKVSFDLVGGNFNEATHETYPTASYDERKAMIDAHKKYQQGILWTLQNHPRIPAEQRKKNAEWGYAKDEFTSNNNWPYSIYVRESRRMNGMHVLTQQDVQNRAGYIGDAVAGLGSYNLDSHVVRRVVMGDQIYDEGWFYIREGSTPFPIPYQAILPQADEATNLLNPVTLSATHVGFSAVRMEPTFMVLGQSAGTAAVLAIQQGCTVQDVDRKKLNSRLKSDKQKVSY
ncbi:hypothetical protein NA57DRAFT_61778 [Rhizodiscina lignyota]|uniref:FAD dependent oxidoreductase n=1 Tax=Rhizodiscina lignyota TaxID=1504668 RepID=A0A9P4M1B9_9PEZI|nr:hypothetical protein NA57DRAFT_61778 [Rhizodiscina lignyota]